jgi:Peptidase family C25
MKIIAQARRSLTITLLAITLLGLAAPSTMQAEPTSPLHITARADGVHLEWHVVPGSFSILDAQFSIPELEIGGARLPAQLLALHLADDTPAAPRIDRLESAPWTGTIQAADVPIPQTNTGERRPALAARAAPALPESPVVVLREGRMRGARVIVLAFSPIFMVGNRPRAATRLEATIPRATPLAESAAQLLASSAPFLATVPGPTNPAAATQSIRVRVAQPGIQRVTGAALAAAGLNLSVLDPKQIHVRHSSVEIAIEERLGGDGKLDPTDELRFYAWPPGDRWNAADTYWLTIEPTQGRRMVARSAMPGAAPSRPTALDRGVWRGHALYDSLLPGPDGDHFFAADLKTGPEQPPMMITALLTPALPLAAGTTTLTVTGSAYTPGAHNLQVRLGAMTKLATWSDAGDWARVLTFTSSAASAELAIVPGTSPDGVEPDGVAWERLVTLNFGANGAAFAGIAGTWRYQLSGTPTGRALYDVTDPAAPQPLNIPAGADAQFQDGPAPRQYILAGPGTLHTPEVTAHAPASLVAPLDADVVYIAPAAFRQALAPLVARRQAQGHVVAVVDAQAIYDAWSFGQVEPGAIRAFLRYAAATWRRAPAAVALVGDGTADPLGYTRHGDANLIPPYLAMVDLWVGETACETCYAQLDGDDPLSDTLPDLVLGRLPVKSVAELQALVAKIIGYETAGGGMDWRSRAVFVADNYRDANNLPDGAGDFAAFADAGAATLPQGVEAQRLYYDPSPARPAQPWREPNAAAAYTRTLELLNAGAGLVTYVGHSHQWQWAVTDATTQPSYLLGLYDADDLTNAGRPFVLLEMTCLTAAFQTPAYSGTTIDERLLLAPGGAVAVWGPTGLGVAHGHDALQHGFHTALWDAPPMTAQIGVLAAAGYLELFSNGGCCQDALHTFALLGDPLTPARVRPAKRVYLPGIRS